MTFYEIGIGDCFKPSNVDAIFMKMSHGLAVLYYQPSQSQFTSLDFPGHCQPVKMLAPSKIKLRKGESRRQYAGLVELVAHIKEHGVIQPITLSDDGYLIDGWFRRLAAMAAELEFVPVVYSERG